MNKGHLLSIIAASLAFGGNYAHLQRSVPEPRRKDPIKPPIPKGCKEFTIDGITVIASNEKNALRKVKAIQKATS